MPSSLRAPPSAPVPAGTPQCPRPRGRPLTCAVSHVAGARPGASGSRSACSGRRRTRTTSRTSWTLPALPRPTTPHQVSAEAWADEAGVSWRWSPAWEGAPPRPQAGLPGYVRTRQLRSAGLWGVLKTGRLVSSRSSSVSFTCRGDTGPEWGAALAFWVMPPQNRGCHWRAPSYPSLWSLPDCEHPRARAHMGTHVSP